MIIILIKETDPELGCVTFRECKVTSAKLEAYLKPEQSNGKVEIVGGIWDNKPLSVKEAVEKNIENFHKNFNLASAEVSTSSTNRK